MKHMKRMLALVVACLLLFSLAACGETDETTPRTAVPVDYSGEKISVTLSNTAADYGLIKLLDSDVYSFSSSDDLLEATMASDLAVAPLWRVAELSASSSDLKVLAVTTFGQSSVVTNGVDIGGVKDLDGKTIAVAQAYPASAASMSRTFDQTVNMTQAILEKYGTKASLEYDAIENVYDKIVAGSVQIAVLPEPYASLVSAKSSAEVAFTLTDALSDSGEKSPLVEYCVVAKASFAEKNPKGVEKLLYDLRASVEWVNLNPLDAVNLLIEKKMVDSGVLEVDSELSDRKAETAQKQQAIDLIARSNIVVMEGESMISAVKQSAFLQQELPDDIFYISK